MNIKRILVIEDDKREQNLLRDACECLNLLPLFFIPQNYGQAEMIDDLKKFIENNQPFDIALLDYQIWGYKQGTIFVDTLKQNKIPFVGYSSMYTYNSELVKAGAVTFVNKEGFEVKDTIKNIESILQKLS